MRIIASSFLSPFLPFKNRFCFSSSRVDDVWAFVFHPPPLKLSILLSVLLSPPSSLHLHHSLHLPFFFHASEPRVRTLNSFLFILLFFSVLSRVRCRLNSFHFLSLPCVLIPLVFSSFLLSLFRPCLRSPGTPQPLWSRRE